jgi:hypothetical protein
MSYDVEGLEQIHGHRGLLVLHKLGEPFPPNRVQNLRVHSDGSMHFVLQDPSVDITHAKQRVDNG